MMNIAKLRKENERYRNANPWTIINLQNTMALCGRYPNREAAEQQGATYRGGVVEVNTTSKTVYVSDMPSL
jgi:hypothetical protein